MMDVSFIQPDLFTHFFWAVQQSEHGKKKNPQENPGL
jgi:hypothetical protein